MVIRPVEECEIEIIAERMRATLVEVLGEARGQAMYTMEWLRDRVCFHLDPARSTGAVLVAEEAGGVVASLATCCSPARRGCPRTRSGSSRRAPRATTAA